ncbi:serine hydrolase domain-containing protein [Stakelama tenebrarum]|uniref:Beta-lactamase family protein n=1 Tax=Stakelama tenebrarum TaxID=2711215 RepID=A0A6G6Y857_9SPHN|nr:serine hydrolase domain-containing protein [Sphingosinithalassobacter tenebrarum]QIG81124.1 beta-lactamase family protein [Sphingosinithalassobacter tenebrarum]
MKKHLLASALSISTVVMLATPALGQEVQQQSSYVETRLNAEGDFVTTPHGAGRENALYQAGSISKYACSIAALDLQRQGKLRLSDTLADLLPGYTGTRAGEITLEQLLRNRSSIADGLMAAVREDPQATLALELTPLEAANRFGTGYTGHQPGEAFEYMILNWAFVQAILERAADKPIARILDETVFAPAGMAHSTSFVGSLPGPDPVAPVGQVLPMPSYLVCAGGVASTPADLIRLLRYPYTDGYPEADRRALEAVASPDSHYALGGRTRYFTVEGVTHNLSWKSGSNGAFKSRAAYDPVTGLGYAVVTNEGDNGLLYDLTAGWVHDMLGVEITD